MIRLAAVLVFMAGAGPAWADPCDDLITALQGAITAPGTSDADRGELEALLGAGRAAKSAGDVASCEAALTAGGLQSPRPSDGIPGRPPGYKCEKTQDQTV